MFFGLESGGSAMLRKGDWKILNTERPFNLDNFQLYNLRSDLAEQVDLKDQNSEKYQEMISEWEKWSKNVGVILPFPKSKDIE